MNICVLLVPYDSGRYRERMGRGPDPLFQSSVEPLLIRLGHNVRAEEITISDSLPAEIKTAFALCRSVAERVRACRRNGWFPLVISGNCNTAVGTISGCGCETTGVVWFDAHGEATTPETTTSGFLDGMGISILTGQCWRNLAHSISEFEPVSGQNILLVGSRDLEAPEVALLDAVGVRRLSRARDVGTAAPNFPAQIDGTYLHFDLDVLDPTEAVTNQWSPPGGLTVASVADAVKDLRRHKPIKAAGIASYDPEADCDGRGARATEMILEAVFAGT
jgi:arginase